MNKQGPITAVVAATDDPLGLGRVQIRREEALDGLSLWARVLSPVAGVQFRPEVGDEVLVDFLNGDRRQPIILGALWSEGRPPPAAPQEQIIRTAGGHTISLHDGPGREQVAITSAGGRRLLLDDTGQGRIELRNGDGTLRLVLDDTTGALTIEATAGDLALVAAGDLSLSAININLDAAAQVNIAGRAGVDVETNAMLQLRSTVAQLAGSVVQIDGAQVLVNGRPLS